MIRYYFLSFISIVFICSNNCIAQKLNKITNCNCSILVEPKFKGKISLYNSPNGKIIGSIQNNFKDEDYLVLKIKQSAGNFFYVIADYSIAGYITKGWIKKSNSLGIYSKIYTKSDSLILYSLPNKKAGINAKIKKYSPKMLVVLNCDGQGWVEVRMALGNKICRGWVPPEMQCDNPYTTCD